MGNPQTGESAGNWGLATATTASCAATSTSSPTSSGSSKTSAGPASPMAQPAAAGRNLNHRQRNGTLIQPPEPVRRSALTGGDRLGGETRRGSSDNLPHPNVLLGGRVLFVESHDFAAAITNTGDDLLPCAAVDDHSEMTDKIGQRCRCSITDLHHRVRPSRRHRVRGDKRHSDSSTSGHVRHIWRSQAQCAGPTRTRPELLLTLPKTDGYTVQAGRKRLLRSAARSSMQWWVAGSASGRSPCGQGIHTISAPRPPAPVEPGAPLSGDGGSGAAVATERRRTLLLRCRADMRWVPARR